MRNHSFGDWDRRDYVGYHEAQAAEQEHGGREYHAVYAVGEVPLVEDARIERHIYEDASEHAETNSHEREGPAQGGEASYS